MRHVKGSVTKVEIKVERLRGKGYRATCLILIDTGETQVMEKVYRNKTLRQTLNDLELLKQDFFERGLKESQVVITKPLVN